jgi:hypothetical protein
MAGMMLLTGCPDAINIVEWADENDGASEHDAGSDADASNEDTNLTSDGTMP